MRIFEALPLRAVLKTTTMVFFDGRGDEHLMSDREQQCVFDLPLEVDSVPDTQYGVYAFRLSLPNDTQLGLTSSADPAVLAEDLARRVARIRWALSDLLLNGQMSSNQATHMRQVFSVSANPVHPTAQEGFVLQLIGELGGDLKAVKSAASVVRYALELSAPIYVGMTSRQSFRIRLDQHMAGSTQFSDRLAKLKIGWSDLKFVIRPFHVPAKAVRTAEQMAQALLKPRVSLA
jgi:hypothetical protein